MKPPLDNQETNPFTQRPEQLDKNGRVISVEISSAEVGDLAVSAYEAMDGVGGRALDEAAKYLEINPDGPNKFGFAQRAMESVLKAGEWTDETRQAAEDMNTAQRLKDGRPAKTFEGALEEMSAHAEAWLNVSKADGWDDHEVLRQEGVALAYVVRAAGRGDVKAVDFLIKTVEGFLAHQGRLTEQERQAEMYRDLRDALFEKKKQLMTAEVSKEEEARKQVKVDEARSDVESVFTMPKTEDAVDRVDASTPAEFGTKTPEEREFLKALVLVRGDFQASQISELGFTREAFKTLTNEQHVKLTGVLKSAHTARMYAVGPEAIAQVKDVLVRGIAEIMNVVARK